MQRTSWMAVMGLVLALVVAVRVEEGRVQSPREPLAELAPQAMNVRAERDSTSGVAMTPLKIAELLGDLLRVAGQLVVQCGQRAETLDRALGRECRARHQAAAVDSPAALVASYSADEGRARFDLRPAPYTIEREVAIPASPESARMAIDVALDSILLDLTAGCPTANRHGICATTVDAVTPRWATVRFGRLD